MRVLLSVSLALAMGAGAARAQDTTTERPPARSFRDFIDEEVAGRAPVSRPPIDRPASNPFTDDQVNDPVERVCRPAKNPSAVVANDQARALLSSGLSRLAANGLRRAIKNGNADAETHYLLASALRKEAEEARQRAARLAAEGKHDEAAQAREEALALNEEALAELGRGRDHAHSVIDERLAKGDVDGARSLGEALLRSDPTDRRAADAAAARRRAAPEATNGGGGSPSGGGASPSSGGDSPSSGGSPSGGSPPAQTQPQAATDQTSPTVPTADEETPGRSAKRRAPPMNASQAELEILARIVKGEAGVCSYEGKVAVAAVVLNRVRSPDFPSSIRGVAHQPQQFSCYNANKRAREYFGPIPEDCWRAAREALAGNDPTSGSTYYYNPFLVKPSWARTMKFVVRIGSTATDAHDFYKPRS